MKRLNGYAIALSILAAVGIVANTHSNINPSPAKLKTPAQATPAVDPESGLKIAPGWDVVKTNCTACHSAKIIIVQQGSRETWRDTIRWMQKKQGLSDLPAETEKMILDYLEKNYAPGKKARRANLPASALPPNPWR